MIVKTILRPCFEPWVHSKGQIKRDLITGRECDMVEKSCLGHEAIKIEVKYISLVILAELRHSLCRNLYEQDNTREGQRNKKCRHK